MAGPGLGAELVLSLGDGGVLAQFNEAGVLAAVDVHVARPCAGWGVKATKGCSWP